MLTDNTSPPETAPTNRREMLRYMERFQRWARKLDDIDLGAVTAFCANVQMAWTDGQAKLRGDTPAEQVEKGMAPMPGLGAAFDTGSNPDYDPNNPVGLEKLVKED